MWKAFSGVVGDYARLSLEEERRLILEAQTGSKKSKDEIVLRHLKFLNHRIRRIVFPSLYHQFKDDLLAEGFLIIYKKIESYDLDYRDGYGNPKPVKFTSYIWKRIDGYILDFLKKERMESNPHARFAKPKTTPVVKSPIKPVSAASCRQMSKLVLTTHAILPRRVFVVLSK